MRPQRDFIAHPISGSLGTPVPEVPLIKFQPTGDFIHIEIIPVCDHPADAIMWNPWNLVIQCHRCGAIIEALTSSGGCAPPCPTAR